MSADLKTTIETAWEEREALGMVTLWVDNGSEQAGRGASDDFIDYRTTDVARWLHGILGDEQA